MQALERNRFRIVDDVVRALGVDANRGEIA